ncbi:hypothetical protein B296_00033976 [Ensete ventricosum]|uniref:Uncharacterized protein n=1 Tax=Ensete ventricosum TaxID=4639 RepID=A0A426ZU19_ENSVE|nr:hypothetical protein B296_00033976 [Ensete ventricosum]
MEKTDADTDSKEPTISHHRLISSSSGVIMGFVIRTRVAFLPQSPARAPPLRSLKRDARTTSSPWLDRFNDLDADYVGIGSHRRAGPGRYAVRPDRK